VHDEAKYVSGEWWYGGSVKWLVSWTRHHSCCALV